MVKVDIQQEREIIKIIMGVRSNTSPSLSSDECKTRKRRYDDQI